MDDIFEEYSLIQNNIDVLTKKKEELRPRITAKVAELGGEAVETALGKFSLSKKKTYTFSEKIAEMEEYTKSEIDTLKDTLEEAKAKEISNGAPFVEEDALRYTASKF